LTATRRLNNDERNNVNANVNVNSRFHLGIGQTSKGNPIVLKDRSSQWFSPSY